LATIVAESLEQNEGNSDLKYLESKIAAARFELRLSAVTFQHLLAMNFWKWSLN